MKLVRPFHPLAALLGLLLSVAPLHGQEPVPPATPANSGELAKPAAAEGDDKVAAPEAPDTAAGEINVVGQNVHVLKGEKVSSVVVTQGSATIDGEVEENVVVVNGKLRINGRVHGDAVNVGSGLVLGTGAQVGGKAVGILGGIVLGTNSLVGGDAVGIVGGITSFPGAKVRGQTVPIGIPNLSQLMGPDGLQLPQWVEHSFHQLVLKARPLAFSVGWTWILAGIFALSYAVLLVLFPRPMAATTQTLDERAVTSFLMGLLSLPLLLFLALILTATGVGLIVVPFLFAAFVLAVLFGKAALLCHLGGALLRQFKGGTAPLAAFATGLVLVTLFYVIPFIGLLAWAVLTMWGLGAALLALFGSFRKERAPAATVPTGNAPVTRAAALAPAAIAVASAPVAPVTTAAPTAPIVPAEPVIPAMNTPLEPSAPSAGPGHTPYIPPVTPAVLSLPEALTLPRAGFGRRLSATVLDWVLLLFLVHGPILGWLPDRALLHGLLFLAYFAGFYVWKGTTLGGLILGLKVVRLDGRKIDYPCALVRGVGALFSFIAAGLGYFWCAWDPERQTWHDKLAGTVVVRVEKMQPLV
jgi:uncharacterized RDD family membrane protein YckC